MNILNIHQSILNQFDIQRGELPQLKETLRVLRTSKKTRIIESHIQALEKKIHQLEKRDDYYYYLLRVTPLIEAYKKELNKPIQVDFMGEVVKHDTSYKDELCDKFLAVAGRFIECYREVQETSPVRMECDHCNQSSMKKIDSASIVCKNCGVQKEMPNITFSYKDVNRINITSRYTYDRRIHFRDCINQFQGKQNSTIASEVYEKLKQQFERHNLVNPKYPTTDPRRYSKVTKDHVYMFLKENNDSNHYEDGNLIYHRITGKPLNDISHLEDVLMSDFDKLSELYDEIYIKNKKITRKNFINTQYVLYQLLRRHKYPCNKNDFNFLKTTERKAFHDDVCSTLFAQLEWKFYPCF